MVVHVARLFLLPALLSRRGRRSYKARCFRGGGAAPTKISRPNSYMVGGATRPDIVVQIAGLFLLPALLSRRGRRSYKARCFRGEGAAPARLVAFAAGALLLQIYRIPMRVIAHFFYQARTYWVGNDVSGNIDDVFIFANGVIVIAWLPDGFTDFMCACGFNCLHQLWQCLSLI